MKAIRFSLSVAILAIPILASLSLRAQSQPTGTMPKTPDFKLGQVWTMNQAVTVTILAIEEVHKIGKVVHVRVDNIPWQSCGDFHLTRTIEHIAVTEKMLVKSGLVLSKENTDLPPSSIEAYREWQGQKKHEIAKAPLPTLLQAQGFEPPMICNILPSQT
jgi:hypothetical protein